MFTWRTDAEAEAPILRPPDTKSWLIGKDPDAGKDWEQEKKGKTEDEMGRWHHWLNGHEFEQTLGNCGEQGRFACCSPWDCKESDTTESLNNNNRTWGWYLLEWDYCLYKKRHERASPSVPFPSFLLSLPPLSSPCQPCEDTMQLDTGKKALTRTHIY